MIIWHSHHQFFFLCFILLFSVGIFKLIKEKETDTAILKNKKNIIRRVDIIRFRKALKTAFVCKISVDIIDFISTLYKNR